MNQFMNWFVLVTAFLPLYLETSGRPDVGGKQSGVCQSCVMIMCHDNIV